MPNAAPMTQDKLDALRQAAKDLPAEDLLWLRDCTNPKIAAFAVAAYNAVPALAQSAATARRETLERAAGAMARFAGNLREEQDRASAKYGSHSREQHDIGMKALGVEEARFALLALIEEPSNGAK